MGSTHAQTLWSPYHAPQPYKSMYDLAFILAAMHLHVRTYHVCLHVTYASYTLKLLFSGINMAWRYGISPKVQPYQLLENYVLLSKRYIKYISVISYKAYN